MNSYMITRILFLALFALAATMTIPDAFAPGKDVDVSVLSTTQADRLFTEFKSHTEIPFNYPPDGCYARATAMSKIAEEDKIEMGKVWATGYLRVKTKSKYTPTIEWGYHVAPVVYVSDGGKPKLMVFDPSLFDKPVTVDEWTAKMNVDGNPKPHLDKIYYGARYQFGPLDTEPKKYSWNKEDIETSKEVMEEYTETEKKLEALGEGFNGGGSFFGSGSSGSSSGQTGQGVR